MVLLRSSHPENGKVVHRTLGNLSSCSPEEIQAVRLALQHKDQLTEIINQFQLSPPSQSPPAPPTSSAPTSAADAHFTQGPSVSALILLSALAKELGISEVLGEDRQGKLALWQVIARALDQGSRLIAVRLAPDLGAATILDLPFMLVVMLAYQLMKALGERWAKLDVTVAEGLDRLNTYCAVEVAGTFQLLLEPRKDVKELLEAASVTLPNVIVKSKSRVSTKRKLPQSRPRRSK